MNAIRPSNPSDDDGFGGSHRSGRLIRGIRIGWNSNGRTPTGAPRRAELVIVGIKRVLQKWKDGKPEVIDTFPLPDPELLNDAIPNNEWETDWTIADPALAAYGRRLRHRSRTARALTPTSLRPLAAHIAIDHLDDAIDTMGMLAARRLCPWSASANGRSRRDAA